MALPGSDWQEG